MVSMKKKALIADIAGQDGSSLSEPLLAKRIYIEVTIREHRD